MGYERCEYCDIMVNRGSDHCDICHNAGYSGHYCTDCMIRHLEKDHDFDDRIDQLITNFNDEIIYMIESIEKYRIERIKNKYGEEVDYERLSKKLNDLIKCTH